MNAQLKRFAETDLRAARREGDHLVARTKLGNLTISYENRNYKIVANGFEPEQIYCGPKAGAIEVLIDAYDVQLTRKPYKPDPKKFESYVEWRQVNVTGTYADYRKATA